MRKKSLNSLKNTLIELNFRQEWIPEFIHHIEQCIKKGAVLVLLFGSRAKGEFLRDSDIDLLIVSPDLPADIRDRTPGFSAIHCRCSHFSLLLLNLWRE
ncbi:MAG: nucleotidyltransferase domain-containing protein [Candidatus Methanoperedens sp.]|nr:nucleotidyltransferase domain-containing protein [Candidatus Methanoperedens sp.]